jgi:hypothetical protein
MLVKIYFFLFFLFYFSRPAGILFHEQLLHYFRNDIYTNSIKDEITQKTAGGTKRPDFIGYNVLDLKTKEQMTQEPFGICSVLNVYPSTGIINVTKFTVQSRENIRLAGTTYRFFYYIKGVSNLPVPIVTQNGNPDINVIFEYPNIPNSVLNVDIEVYVELISDKAKSYTIFKQLKLFRESSPQAQLNYKEILQTLSIVNNMNDDNILDAQKAINRLETDLPNTFNSNFTKPITVKEGSKIKLNKATCTDAEFCNGRGYCYNVEVLSYCTCFKDYTGRFCQLSKINANTLKEYQSKLNTITTYNLITNKNYNIPNAITNKEIEAINLGFTTENKVFEKLSDMNSYINIIDCLVRNSPQGNIAKVITINAKVVLDIPGKMIGYVQSTIYQTQYMNLKNQIKSTKKYTDTTGKYTIRFLPKIGSNIQTNNSIGNSTINNSTSAGRKITRKDFRRNLQENEDDDFVITINDPSILSLTDEQNSEFKESYTKIYSQIDSLTKIFINGSIGKPIKINQANEMYNYTLDYFYTSEIEKLDFKNYFSDRVEKGQTYFDAKSCLLENSNLFATNDLNYFYMAYFFDETPFFNLNGDLLNRAVSLNSYMTLYDANANEIKLSCTNPIKHYIAIYPQNQDFIDKFNLYPQKYQSLDPIYQLREYMPYYIFSNGTIDHKNSLDVQKDLYYKQYVVNVTDYRDPKSSDSENFKYIIDIKYIYAEIKRTGKFASFVYFNPLTGPMGNNYYMKYNQIFKCRENFTENPCFIWIIIFFAFNMLILLLIILLRNLIRKYYSANESSLDEEKLMDKDNSIFGSNRYSYWGNTGIVSNPINDSKIGENNMVLESNKNEAGDIPKRDGEVNPLNDNDNENIAVRSESDAKMQKVDIGNPNNEEYKGIFYSFVYFVIFRNIYSSFILLSSPFSPKYKTFSKITFLIYSLMLFTCIFFIFAPFDLFGKVKNLISLILYLKFFI